MYLDEIVWIQREAPLETLINQRPFLFVLERHNRPIRQTRHPVMDINRHQMEFAGLGEDIHPQHGVVLGDAAAYWDAGQLVDDLDERTMGPIGFPWASRGPCNSLLGSIGFRSGLLARRLCRALPAIVPEGVFGWLHRVSCYGFIHQFAWILLVILFLDHSK